MFPTYEIELLPDLLIFDTVAGTVAIIKAQLKRFVTTRLAPNPYWRFSGILSEDEVKKILKILADEEREDKELLKKAIYYILFYAENHAFTVWLLLYAKDAQEAEEYYKFMKPYLEELRKLSKSKPTKKTVKKMIEVCLEVAIDPF